MNEAKEVTTAINPYIAYIMPIVTLLIGALAGFLFSIWKDKINEDRTQKKEKKELAVKRLDEIFFYLSKTDDMTRKTLTTIISNKEPNNKRDEISTKISFLIRVHFPHLTKDFQNHLQVEFDYAFYQIELATKQKKVDELKLKQLAVKYEESFKNFCDLIINEATKFNK